MKKLISLADIPNQLEVEELLDIKGGDGVIVSCSKGVSAITCDGKSSGISCNTSAVTICPSGAECKSGAGKVDPPGGGDVKPCEAQGSN